MGRPKKIEQAPDPHGRPLQYETAEEMQAKIDEYFNSCKGEVLYNDDGSIKMDKYGHALYKVMPKVPTLPELAYFLGFKSRQSLINYNKRDGFLDIITRARLYVESVNAQLSYDRDSFQGARLNLQCNYGYTDKQTVDGAIGVMSYEDYLKKTEQKDEY